MIQLTNLLSETKNPKPAICAINIKSMTAFLPDDRFYVVMDWLAAEYRAGNVLLARVEDSRQ